MPRAVTFRSGPDASWDSTRKGIGYLLEQSGATGLEYLNDGTGNYTSFVFDGEIANLTINGISGWQNGVFGRSADGAFTYDSGTGRVSNSSDRGQQYRALPTERPRTHSLLPRHREHPAHRRARSTVTTAATL